MTEWKTRKHIFAAFGAGSFITMTLGVFAHTQLPTIKGPSIGILIGLVLSVVAAGIARDIDKRVRADRKLRENERLFREVFEHAQSGMFVGGLDGRLIQVNAAFCQIVGFSERELLGTTWMGLIHPDDLGPALQRRERLCAVPVGCVDAELRYIHRDGNVVWTRVRVSLVRDGGGTAAYFVVNVEDITERKRADEALRESEARFHTMADGCPTIMWATNSEGGNQFVNRTYREFFDTTYEEVEGGKWQPLIHRDDAPEYLAGFYLAVRERSAFRGEARVRRADGVWRWIASYAEPRWSPSGEYLGHGGISTDISERKEAEEALRSSEGKFRQLAENIHEVFWMMDMAATEIIYVSPAYEQIWGQTCQGLYANPEGWMDSIHPEDRRHAEETFRRQVQGEVVENEYRILQPTGAVRWIRDRAFPIRDRNGNIVRLAGVAEDTTERKLSEFRLAHQALYDELTDLPNRRLFRERLEQAIAECGATKSGAVFFIDLDQFKLVNDTLGHSAGDQLLKEAAQRLLAACGDSGILGRFGGDEFTLVATGFEGPDAVRALGHQLLRCLDEPFRIADRELFIGASIGISLFPENGTDPIILKMNANIAMHEAKRAGKKALRFFTPVLAEAAREHLELETRLRKALAQSEFKLQFQPQFASGGSRARRFEALVRWYPPNEQPIAPLKFIPIAEQNGLIIPIGKWVLSEACQRCAEWQTGNMKGVGVAVNVSASQFACPDFVDTVVQTLESTGIPPDLLELELTESVLIRDVKASARTLTKLRSLGVTIALDDFGTGHSSLSYLQNLPLDAVKIDRSFLIEAESRRQGTAVLRCIVELAHTLGLRVVGEGVETTAQLDLLGRLGCDEFQGYLLGVPSFDMADTGNAIRKPGCLSADVTLSEDLRLLSHSNR